MTGVLPVTLEDSRRVVQALLYSGKEYVCVMRLHGDVAEQSVRKVLAEFEDVIYQKPPLRASVRRQLRTRRVYRLDFLEMVGRDVLFVVGCEGGTYIRKLCFDIGEVLGCGAHMQELRRTRAGPFVEHGSATLHDVAYWFMEWQNQRDEKSLHEIVQPMEKALALVPSIFIRDSAVDAVCHGANLTAPGVSKLNSDIQTNSPVAIFSLKGEAVALGKATVASDDILKMEHGIVASIERVLMARGTYPKGWRSGEKSHDQ